VAGGPQLNAPALASPRSLQLALAPPQVGWLQPWVSHHIHLTQPCGCRPWLLIQMYCCNVPTRALAELCQRNDCNHYRQCRVIDWATELRGAAQRTALTVRAPGIPPADAIQHSSSQRLRVVRSVTRSWTLLSLRVPQRLHHALHHPLGCPHAHLSTSAKRARLAEGAGGLVSSQI